MSLPRTLTHRLVQSRRLFPASRSLSHLSSRPHLKPASISWNVYEVQRRPLAFVACSPSFTHRTIHSTASRRLDADVEVKAEDLLEKKKAGEDGAYDPEISQEQLKLFHDAIQRFWPTVSVPLPPGWSNDWKKWDHLLTLYWPSQYFLMLPQNEMLFNILYGLKGMIWPIAYMHDDTSSPSPASGARVESSRTGEKAVDGGPDLFVFTVEPYSTKSEPGFVGSKYFIFDFNTRVLFQFPAETVDDEQLVSKLSLYSPSSTSPNRASSPPPPPSVLLPTLFPGLLVVEPTSTGVPLINSILLRDENVIPEIIQGEYLGHVPRKTEPWEEDPKMLKRLISNVEVGSDAGTVGGITPGGAVDEMMKDMDLEKLEQLAEELEKEVEELKRRAESNGPTGPQ